jgi:hypothetical protein
MSQQVAYAVPVSPPPFKHSFKHIYNIYVRKPLCFGNYFTLNHDNGDWCLQFFNNTKKYIIPNKSPENLCKVLIKIGVKKNGYYKLELINDGEQLFKKTFYKIANLIDYIYDTETKLEGVSYT